MKGQTNLKRERVVEAVRRDLSGEAAVQFLHQEGYAMTSSVVARHLRNMGGRVQVEGFIGEGLTNLDILHRCFPEADLSEVQSEFPGETKGLFALTKDLPASEEDEERSLYATRKLTVTIPSELFEAIRAAARGEGKSQNQVIVDILTSTLSRMPEQLVDETEPE